jgi:hypothetical protein
VSVEFTFTPKRKQIVWMTMAAVILSTVVLTAIVFLLVR